MYANDVDALNEEMLTMTPSKKPEFISKETVLPFVLVTALFFMWGIPNNLNGVLIKQFMKSMELSLFQAGLVQSAFYMGYFLFALPAALSMKKLGYKSGIVQGLIIYAVGCLLFWPAAHIGRYSFFLFSLFIVASGLAFLETGANPFIALLGDRETSERRLNFSQAFNPVGSVVGVLLGTVFVFSGYEPDAADISAMKLAGSYDVYLHSETMRVVRPYLFLAAFAIVWALLILKTKFPEIDEAGGEPTRLRGSFRSLFKVPVFRRGVVAQFLYVGAQVGTWSYFIPYFQMYAGQTEKIAGYFLTGTLVAFGLGRFVSVWLMRFVQPVRLLGIFSLSNAILVAVSMLLPGWTGAMALFLTSFFMSLMYPTIFAISIKGLGTQTKIGGSVLVMAIIGGAVCTPLIGYLAETTGSIAFALIIALLAYMYVFFFAVSGSKIPAGHIRLESKSG